MSAKTKFFVGWLAYLIVAFLVMYFMDKEYAVSYKYIGILIVSSIIVMFILYYFLNKKIKTS
jgi:hypothetical protein